MPVKGSVVTDEAYLKMLAGAREKANAVRKVKSDEKKKIKLAEQLEHQTKVMDAEEKLKRAAKASAPSQKVDKVVEVEKSSKAKRPKMPTPPSSENESEDYSSSESEEDEAPPPPPKPAKVARKPAAPPAQSRPQARAPLTPQQRRMMEAMRSLYI